MFPRNGKEPPMLTPPTLEQLQQLKLTALAAAWTAQQADASCRPGRTRA
jgi:hypothetical protein